MIKKMLLYSGWAVCALAGCTMIPRYQRPAAPVAGRFPDGADRSGDAADIGWRDFFADPRLKQLVALAL